MSPGQGCDAGVSTKMLTDDLTVINSVHIAREFRNIVYEELRWLLIRNSSTK